MASPLQLTDPMLGSRTWGNDIGAQPEQKTLNQLSRGGHPFIEILEQPRSRGLRFRFKSEGKSIGTIPGESSTNKKRVYPTIKICNYTGPSAIVIVSCVTKDDPPRPHPYSLVGKDCRQGVCTVKLKGTTQVSFPRLNIECTTKREIQGALERREKIRIDPWGTGYYQNINSIELSKVCLAFQAFLPDDNGKYSRIVQPIVSHCIYDKKEKTGLVIYSLSKKSGSVRGGDEIFLLCGKVTKDDIQVRFFEENKDEGVVRWEKYGIFGQQDVHRQLAIVFKTPEYREQAISQPVTVMMQLHRPSDDEVSDPKPFQYIPIDQDQDCVARIRKRKTMEFDKFLKDYDVPNDFYIPPTPVSVKEKVKRPSDDEVSDPKPYQYIPIVQDQDCVGPNRKTMGFDHFLKVCDEPLSFFSGNESESRDSTGSEYDDADNDTELCDVYEVQLVSADVENEQRGEQDHIPSGIVNCCPFNRGQLISNPLRRRSKSLPNVLSTPPLIDSETYKMAKSSSCMELCLNKEAPFQCLSYKVNADCNGGVYHMPSIHSNLYIPQGALMKDNGKVQEIEIIQHERGDAVRQHSQYQSASHVYEFLPHGQDFEKPVMFKFPLLLYHQFSIKGLKVLYSSTTRNQSDVWIELPIRSSDENHQNGFGWFIWEKDCFITMNHFCKIHVVASDDAESTQAVFVKTLLFAHYAEQKQMVELRLLFTCAEDDNKHQNKIKSLGHVECEKYLLVYENRGDLEISLKLANPGEWKIPEELAAQILDKNFFFLTQLCKLSSPIDHIFPLDSRGSADLDAHVYIKQRKQNNAQQPPFFLKLDINNIQRIKSQQKLLEEATLELQREKDDILKQKEADHKIVKALELEKIKLQQQYELDKVELQEQNKVLTEQLEHSEKHELQSNAQITEGDKDDQTNKKGMNNIQIIKSQQKLLEEATLELQREKEDILKQKEADNKIVKALELEKIKLQQQYELDKVELQHQNKVLTKQLEHSEKTELQSKALITEGDKDDQTKKKIYGSQENYPTPMQRQKPKSCLPQPVKADHENKESKECYSPNEKRPKKSCISQPKRRINSRNKGMSGANNNQMSMCSPLGIGNHGKWLTQRNVNSTYGRTQNVLIQNYYYGEMSNKQNQQNVAIENEKWPAGFDNEFRKYLFSLIVVLDANKDKFHEIVESVGIARENGFDAQMFLSAWYLKKVNNSSLKGHCHAIWIELISVFKNMKFVEAEDELTVAIEKKMLQVDIVDFNNHMCDFESIVTKLFGCGKLDLKQFRDFKKDNDVTKLITEVILQTDKEGFQAFKDVLRENNQTANHMLLQRISLPDNGNNETL